MTPRGALALVLHTHMPYVEGFGTWPFGEEWLWEAVAACYVPLLDVLDAAPGRVTLSVTPVLGDQLEAPGRARPLRVVPARDPARVARARPPRHVRPRRARGARALGGGVRGRRGARRGRPRAPRRARDVDLGRHPRDPAAAGDRRRRPAPARDRDRGAPGAVRRVGRRALAAGVRARAVARPAARGGRGAGGLRRPDRRARRAAAAAALAGGPAARPARPPAAGARLERATATRRAAPTATRTGSPSGAIRRGRSSGGAYEPERATAQARADAAAFVRAAAARVRDGGLATVAVDTELLGLHWHEGPLWLAAVLDEAERAGLRVAPLDALLGDGRPGAAAAGHVVGRAARPHHLERPRRGGARLAPARRRAARARGRAGGAGARAARAARAPVVGLGLPRHARDRRRLPARARGRPRGGVRRGARRRGPAGAARARPAPRSDGVVRSLTGTPRRIPSARVVCSPT